MAPLVGVWGSPTATIDWCEDNYVVNPLFAEFWNTVSNVAMIVLGLVGLVSSKQQGCECRIWGSYLGLFVVGVGSWLFHMTLLYGMQLTDELPMLWCSLSLTYALLQFDERPGQVHLLLAVGLLAYGVLAAAVYLYVRDPLFHEAAYAILVFLLTFGGVRVVCSQRRCSRLLYILSICTYSFGFILWNVDNRMCASLRSLRTSLPGVAAPLTQMHAWWHLLAGMGTYFVIVFVEHGRPLQFGDRTEIVWKYGMPLIRHEVKRRV